MRSHSRQLTLPYVKKLRLKRVRIEGLGGLEPGTMVSGPSCACSCADMMLDLVREMLKVWWRHKQIITPFENHKSSRC